MLINLNCAWRNIKNNKVNSTITVVGLAVAIACALIFYLYISQELNYDNFHKQGNSIYRISYNARYIDFDMTDVRVEPELQKLLKDEIPQIEKSTEYRFAFTQELKYKQNYYYIDAAYAGEEFFDMFSFNFLTPYDTNLFENPNEIILTKSVADRLVESEKNYQDLIGQNVEFPIAFGNQQFSVKGIIDDIPKNSSIRFDIVVSGKSRRNFGGCDNGFGYTSVYYQLKQNADAGDAEKNVNRYLKKYYAERVQNLQDNNMMLKTNDAFVPFVLPLKEIHTANHINSCFETTIRKGTLYILLAIGGVILLIASSNYTILTLGQYLQKIGDVGIRKTMGASSRNIFALFFSEGFIITLISFSLSIPVTFVFRQLFENILGAEIHEELYNLSGLFAFSVLLFLAIVCFASVIPVLVFSKVSPNQIAGKKLTIGKKSYLSQLFVSIQYSISIILIIVSIFIVRQSNLLKNMPLGFDSRNVLSISTYRLTYDELLLFEKKMSEHPGVVSITKTSRNFYNGSSDSYVNKGDGEQVLVFRFKVDENYLPTLKLKLLEGNNFTERNINNYDQSMIVNRKFVEAMDIADDPIGKIYQINGMNMKIIGVVENYHYRTLREKIRPNMMFTRLNAGNNFNSTLIRYHPGNIKDLLNHMKETYAEVVPGKELSYEFWDEGLETRYAEVDRFSNLVKYASIIAILISSLGLFGLTILLINQRIKEIGIRKVNGATSAEVMFTINQSFIAWLFISLMVACPVSYYLVSLFLDTFAYTVELSWWVFALAGGIAFTVAIITVSWQSWKSATRNPIEALRYE